MKSNFNARGLIPIVSLLLINSITQHSVAAEVAGTPTSLPIWPQTFEISGPETAGFGFVVTQPGPVSIDVDTRGMPVVVSLTGPGSVPLQRSGSGKLQLAIDVTPQDLQRGLLWSINIGMANKVMSARASGSVSLTEPPVDVARALGSIKAAARARPSRVELTDAEQAQMSSASAQRLALFEQQRQQSIAREFDKLRPFSQQAQARLAGQVQSRALSRADVATGTLTPLQVPETRPTRTPVTPAPSPTTASSSQAIQSATPSSPQTVMPNPAIVALSLAAGDPGKPVMISGSAFGNGGGEVHLVIAPGVDLVAKVDIWSDTQIFTSVPNATGVQGFDGQLYVIRAVDKTRSNLVAFRFIPRMVRREIAFTTDRTLGLPVDWYAQSNSSKAAVVRRYNANPFGGFFGDDLFFPRTRLVNGWTVNDVYFECAPGSCMGGGFVQEFRPRTDSPFVKVHWWVNPANIGAGMSYLHYVYALGITGAHGLPDGVACVNAPCNDP